MFLWVLTLSCNSLKKGEVAKIKCESFGCFGAYNCTISIFEKDNHLFAELLSSDTSKIVAIKAVDRQKFEKMISDLQVLDESGGCTSSKKYSVYTREGSFVRKDEGCQNVGFDNFQQEIFGVPN
jgi:hypothetical protein